MVTLEDPNDKIDQEDWSDRETLAATISDLVKDLLVYDRREDEQLPEGRIEDMIARGEVTIEQMVDCFRRGLEEELE